MQNETQLSKIISDAKALRSSNNAENKRMLAYSLLFPLFSYLGYPPSDSSSVILHPLEKDTECIVMDYALCANSASGTAQTKAYVKIADKSNNVDTLAQNASEAVRRTQAVAPFLIVTDYYTYNIYIFNNDSNEFQKDCVVSLMDLSDDDIRMFDQLRPDQSINESHPIQGENKSPAPKRADGYSGDYDESGKNRKNRESGHRILGFLLITVSALILAFSIAVTFVHQYNKNDPYTIRLFGSSETTDFRSVSGIVELTVRNDSIDSLSLSVRNTGLPDGVAVVIKLTNREADEFVTAHAVTASADSFSISLDLPSHWDECSIDAEVRVDMSAKQPKAFAEKYGEYGERIYAGSDKFLIGSSTTYYSKDTILSYISEQAKQKEIAERDRMRNLLASYTILELQNGDICIYPAGLSTDDWGNDNPNITATRHSYARIYYSSETQTAKLQYIIGANSSIASWVAGKFILTDSGSSVQIPSKYGETKYHVNTYNGILIWVTFDEVGVANLASTLKKYYSSSTATYDFSGLNVSGTIGQTDKDSVLPIVDLYHEVFAGKHLHFDPEWIS